MQQLPAPALHDLLARLRQQAQHPVLLDVREPWETALARLEVPGTPLLCIPLGEIPARLGELDPAQPVIALCHHGMRSAQVLAFLERQGHAETYNVAGGIDAWSCMVDSTVPRY